MSSYRGKDSGYDKRIDALKERIVHEVLAVYHQYVEELRQDALRKAYAYFGYEPETYQLLVPKRRQSRPKLRQQRLEQIVEVPSPTQELSDVVQEPIIVPDAPSFQPVHIETLLPVPDSSDDHAPHNGYDASLSLLPSGPVNSLGQTIAPVLDTPASEDDHYQDDEEDDTPTTRYLDSIDYHPGARANYTPVPLVEARKVRARRLVDDSARVFDLLLGARTGDKTTLYFRDGRIVHGAIVFNPFKGHGRLINIDQEYSVDFDVDQLRDVKF